MAIHAKVINKMCEHGCTLGERAKIIIITIVITIMKTSDVIGP